MRLILHWYANASIGNGDRHAPTTAGYIHRYTPAGGVLDSILHQIIQHLAQLVWVDVDIKGRAKRPARKGGAMLTASCARAWLEDKLQDYSASGHRRLCSRLAGLERAGRGAQPSGVLW